MDTADIIKAFSTLTIDELHEHKRLSHQREQNLTEQGYDARVALQIKEEMLLQEVIGLWIHALMQTQNEISHNRITGLQELINNKKQELSNEKAKKKLAAAPGERLK